MLSVTTSRARRLGVLTLALSLTLGAAGAADGAATPSTADSRTTGAGSSASVTQVSSTASTASTAATTATATATAATPSDLQATTPCPAYTSCLRTGFTAPATSQTSTARAAAVAAPTPAVCGYTSSISEPRRKNVDRFTTCSWTPNSFVEIKPGTVSTVLGYQDVKIYEWFYTSKSSLTLTHGVAVQALTGSGSMAAGGLKLTAPMPCPTVRPAQGCYSTATGLAVNIPRLAASGTYSTAWTETMVLGTAKADQRVMFRDGLTFTGTGPTAGSKPSNPLYIGEQDSFRCDVVVAGSGCVNPAFTPTIVFDAAANPLVEPVARHMKYAQGVLAGSPGKPGAGNPLTRITSDADINRNRAAACSTFVPDPPTNTTCDEYPFASTAQGGAGASIAAVPSSANSSQGGILSSGYNASRIIDADRYYVQITNVTDSHAGSAAPFAALASQFNTYGNNAGCGDWSGGDATNSVVLPDGQRAWFFSDSFLGNPGKRKELFTTSSVHNSVVVQKGSTMRTMTGGNTCQESNQNLPFFDRYAKTIAEAPEAGGFYWTGDQQLVGSNVIKFYYHGVPDGDLWKNDYAAVASIPASSLQSGTVLKVTPNRLSCAAGGPPALWGTMTLNRTAADGYYYIYGTKGVAPQQLYLARATAANLTNFGSWQFFTSMNADGTANWGGCGSAGILPIGNATGGSVNEINGTIWLIQDEYTGADPSSGTIVAHPSSNPWGFTNRRVPLYTPPEGGFTSPYYHLVYEPRIQNGLSNSANSTPNLTLTYNVNSAAVNTGCVGANSYDGTIYRPRFVDIPKSWFNTYDAVARSGTARVAATGPTITTFQGRRPLTNPRTAPPVGATRSGSASTARAAGIGGVDDWFRHWGDPCPNVPVPTNFTATAVNDGSANLSWTAPGTDVWSYVYQCDASATTCSTASTCSQNAGGYERQFGGLWVTLKTIGIRPIQTAALNGHTFTWYVCTSGAQNGNAIGANGNGGPSNHASAKVTLPVPSAPTGLSGTKSGATLSLKWTAVTFPSAEVYYTPFYWDITAGQTQAQAVAGSPVASPATTMNVTVPNSTHRYGVYLKANNLAGYSAASASIQLG